MTDMPKIPYLIKRGDRYYLQRRVPQELLAEYPNGPIRRALHTSDYFEAKSKVIVANAELEREFAAKRKVLAGNFDQIDRARAVELAEDWLRELLEDDRDWRVGGPSRCSQQMLEVGTEETLARMREALAHSDQSPVQGDIRDVAQRHGLTLQPDSPSWRMLGYAMLEANVRLMESVQRRSAGEVVDAPPSLPRSIPAPSPLPSLAATGGAGITLGELIERYMADPDADRSQTTETGYRVIFRALREMLGEATYVQSISRQDCVQVRDLLRRLPPNATKRFEGLTLAEAADKADEEQLPRLSPTTVNSYLNNLASLFKWAELEELCSRNPARGLQVADRRRNKDKRNPFSTEQLRLIFNAPLYTGCKNDQTGYATPGDSRPRRGRFWVPLLSLFSGMRLNECCQLHTADVRQEKDLWCIIISEDGEPGGDESDRKRVKTEAGERFVPVHPELVRIGFLRYAAAAREAGQHRLFPDLEPDANGYHSGPFSKWFSRFLDKAGAKTAKTSFHSFRHTFRDALREADISPGQVQALGGWASGKTEDNYGSGYRAATLQESIVKVSYPELDLTHLYVD
jgi:integrase